MSHEKIARVISVLCKKTQKQEIIWSDTEKDGIYETSFPNSSIRISEGTDYNEDAEEVPVIILEVINQNGEVIEKVNDDDLKGLIDRPYSQMQELYESARRQAMGVDEALDEILNIIDPLF